MPAAFSEGRFCDAGSIFRGEVFRGRKMTCNSKMVFFLRIRVKLLGPPDPPSMERGGVVLDLGNVAADVFRYFLLIFESFHLKRIIAALRRLGFKISLLYVGPRGFRYLATF